MKCILGSPHLWEKRAQQYCQGDISHRDRTEHAGNISSQHTDEAVSYIPTTALATSPAHSTGSVLLYSAFSTPHLFQPSACDASSNTISLKWLCQAHDGRKQLHPSSLLPATCAHCIVSQSNAIPSRITKHGRQSMLLPQSWPACPHPSRTRAGEYKTVDTEYFEKMPNGSYPGMWI